MIRNKLKLLKKENDKISRWMDDEDENLIDSIMESLGIFRVNSFDAQVIRRDLIGMAEEAKLRGSNMKEVIGEDIRMTTYDIIRNSRGPNKGEIVSLYFKYLFGIVFSLIGFFGIIIMRLGITLDVNIMWLFSLTLSISMFFLLAKLVRPLLSMEGWGRFGFYWTFFTGLSLSSPAIYAASGNLFGDRSLPIPGWIVLTAAGLLYLVSEYFYRKTINELSMDNSNYFEDLIDEG